MAPPDSSKDSATEVSKKVASWALAMAFGTLSSRILGLVREMLFAGYFDRTLTDAWTAAFRLPNLLRRLLGEGSLSVSLIPVFIEARHQSEARAHNLVNSVYLILLLVVSVLTLLGILAAEPILRLLLSPEFQQVPGKFELTLHMARIMFAFVFMISHFAFFMGLLNALGRFALPALAPVLFNVAMIAATWLSYRGWVLPADGLAWGVLIGGFLQAGVLIPILVRAGYWPCLTRGWRVSDDLRKVLRNLGPGLLGTGLVQLMTLVNLRFASSLPQGAVSYVYWADRLLELPLSLVAVSLGTALLPELSMLAARGDRRAMGSTVNFYLRVNLFVALPAALGLFFLARPVVEVLFLRGQFSLTDLEKTAEVLRWDAVLLVFLSGIRVVVPAYYALKNTWLPALISVLALLVHLFLAPLLMERWGLTGLVASTCISAGGNLLGLLACYRHWVGRLDGTLLLRRLGRLLLPLVGLFLILPGYDWLRETLGMPAVAALAIIIATAAGVYALLSFWLKSEELRVILGWRSRG